jgi:hypothetical protein
MNRRRLIAAVFFSVVIVAVLALIVFTEYINNTTQVKVARLSHDVSVGAVLSSNDFDTVPINAHDNDFNFQDPSKIVAGSVRYTQGMKNGDILRPDDLEDASKRVEIQITVAAPPPLVAGDSIDVFALSGAQPLRIGHALPIVSSSGGGLTVLVPAIQEFDWIAVAASQSTLHVVKSTSAPEITTKPPLGVDQAISDLCGCAPAQAPATPKP